MTTPADDRALTAFTDAVRACTTTPGRPNAALAELLATGLLTDQSDPSTRTTGHPARASRRRPRMLLSTLTAKLAAAGVAAKAAAATGVVAIALTGAATTVTLAGSEDTTPAVESTGTAEEPGDTSTSTTGDGAPEDGAPGEETPAGDTIPVDVEENPSSDDVAAATEWAAGPEPDQAFGDWVSEGARNGWSTGQRVSEEAHRRNEERRVEREAARAATPAPVQPAPVQPAPVQPAPVQPAPAPQPVTEEAAPAPAPAPAPAGHGNGHGGGNGNGNGNGGNGGGGNGRK
jgi:hypothetical protein